MKRTLDAVRAPCSIRGMARVVVYCGCSVDGFIAGVDDDLSWLPAAPTDGEGGFDAFLDGVGAVLMGRRTYDVVTSHEGWWYREIPLLVATRRPLSSTRPQVRPVEGPIERIVEEARQAAGDGVVYIDGGILIREALDAGLIDEITVTVIPMILGAGIPLFAGAAKRRPLKRLAVRSLGDLTQMVFAVV